MSQEIPEKKIRDMIEEEFEVYDERLIPNGFGMINRGATCYFNALLQSLFSCSSFNRNVALSKKHNAISEVMKDTIINFLKHRTTNDFSKQSKLENMLQASSSEIWLTMMKESVMKRKDNVRFTSGQQDASEGFHLLLDSIDKIDSVQRLFLHTYQTNISCSICKKSVSEVNNDYFILEINPNLSSERKGINGLNNLSKEIKDKLDLTEESSKEVYFGKSKSLNEYIKRHISLLDKDYKCPKCNDTTKTKHKVDKLYACPEILVVLAKKYTYDKERKCALKINTVVPYPEEITLPYLQGGKLVYEAVAQIEHSGGTNGGHYWAVCKRNDGWKNLNDTGVTSSRFKPTANTYMVFYHIV